ncbi:MAG TPA: SRPBCC family protein [Pedobacter sp.]|jgi:uncharacterized protein YndB with AHSA1/START domain
METTNAKTKITVQTTVNSPVSKVWESFNAPEHIMKWNQASKDWHCPASENDLRTGGRFKHTMAAKDGSFSFDFEGEYINVIENKLIKYVLGDGRTVQVKFEGSGNQTHVIEVFDAETSNTMELQQTGWQAILDNFKGYTEAA